MALAKATRALALAGLLVVTPAGAFAAQGGDTTFVHSADHGVFQDGRLTLRGRGIGRRVTWVHNSGRSGSVAVARMHRLLFGRRRLPATALLQISGRPAGPELALRLSRPRHSASGDWVSYRARRLTKRAGNGRAARALQAAIPRRFGAASLSLVGGPRVGEQVGAGGAICPMGLLNKTPSDFRLVSASKWDTDDWYNEPTVGALHPPGGPFFWGSEGGFLRGCSNTLVFQRVDAPSVTVTITTSVPWIPWLPPSYTCTVSDGNYGCSRYATDFLYWTLAPTNP